MIPWTVVYQDSLWDFPSKNTGVGCHSLLQEIFPTQELNPGLPHCRQILYYLNYALFKMRGVCFCCLATKWFPTFFDPMDYSPAGSSVHGISQVKIVEWVLLFSSSGDLPDPRIKSSSSALQVVSLPQSHQGSPLLGLE